MAIKYLNIHTMNLKYIMLPPHSQTQQNRHCIILCVYGSIKKKAKYIIFKVKKGVTFWEKEG